MADVPSFRSQRKRTITATFASTPPGATNGDVVSGTITYSTDGAGGSTNASVSNRINLAERVLPIQKGALVGSFDGFIFRMVGSALKTAAGSDGTVTAALEVSPDGVYWSTITLGSSYSGDNTVPTFTGLSTTASNPVSGIRQFVGPLPQFIRVKSITVANQTIASGSITFEFFVNG